MNDINLYENIPELSNDTPIKVENNEACYITPHWHEHIELIHILSGGGRFYCGANAVDASCGETVVVNSNELHQLESENIEYVYMIINPSFLFGVDYDKIVFNSKIPKDDIVASAFEKICRERGKGDICSDYIIKGETYLLMSHLVKKYARERLSKQEYDTRIARMNKINKMLEWIHIHYREQITTADLAKKWYLSESHVCHIFKKAVGMTVLEYINRYRVDKAALLLLNTEETISEIAHEVGFDNLNYFDRIFRRYKNMTPKKYQNTKSGQ